MGAGGESLLPVCARPKASWHIPVSAALGDLLSGSCHCSLTFLMVMAGCLVLGGWKFFLVACCAYVSSTVNLALRDLRILLLYIYFR